jgi:hypothetical protein
MQVSPRAQEFGEIHELTPEQEEKFKKLSEEGKIIARGPKEELQLLQDNLRRVGYRQVR